MRAAPVIVAGVVAAAGAVCGFRIGREARQFLDSLAGIGCAPDGPVDELATPAPASPPRSLLPHPLPPGAHEEVVVAPRPNHVLSCACLCHVMERRPKCGCCQVAVMRGVTVW